MEQWSCALMVLLVQYVMMVGTTLMLLLPADNLAIQPLVSNCAMH